MTYPTIPPFVHLGTCIDFSRSATEASRLPPLQYNTYSLLLDAQILLSIHKPREAKRKSKILCYTYIPLNQGRHKPLQLFPSFPRFHFTLERFRCHFLYCIKLECSPHAKLLMHYSHTFNISFEPCALLYMYSLSLVQSSSRIQ